MKTQKFTVKKEDVIKALQTEPLITGSFFKLKRGSSFANCPVCAVGAVLRQSIPYPLLESILKDDESEGMGIGTEVTFGKYVHEDPLELIQEENYLGALSSYFEALTDDTGQEPDALQRQALVEFVQEHFPNEISFTVKESIDENQS